MIIRINLDHDLVTFLEQRRQKLMQKMSQAGLSGKITLADIVVECINNCYKSNKR